MYVVVNSNNVVVCTSDKPICVSDCATRNEIVVQTDGTVTTGYTYIYGVFSPPKEVTNG